MDIWQANGETLVYVINHTKEGDRLEVFKVDFSEKKLLLNTVLSRKLPKNANDISVVKRDQWFISFDHLGEQAWQHKLEDYLRLPLSYIALVSPKDHNIVSKGHRYANGVYYDSNKKLLYVAAMLDRRLSTYQYDEHKQRLVLVDRLNHLGGVDNIMSSPTGNTLWVASHPQLLKLSSMRASANKLSPSRVWAVSLDDEGLPIDASSLFVDKGDTFSASSVALVIDADLYIGSVFDRGLLRCPAVMAE
jgi:arylesterase/paraoxonase